MSNMQNKTNACKNQLKGKELAVSEGGWRWERSMMLREGLKKPQTNKKKDFIISFSL